MVRREKVLGGKSHRKLQGVWKEAVATHLSDFPVFEGACLAELVDPDQRLFTRGTSL